MSDSDKPDGNLEDADGVSTDADGNPVLDMEVIEMSEDSSESEDG